MSVENNKNTEQILLILGQDKAPDAKQLVQLQEELKRAGYFNGSTHPNFGPKTSNAIVKFAEDNPEKAGQIGNWAILKVKENSLGQKIQNALEKGSKELEPASRLSIENDLNELLLKTSDWNHTEKLEIQINLSKLGIEYGKFDGDIGEATSKAITAYIEDNPDLLATISDETFMHLITEGQAQRLKEVILDDPINIDIIDERIKTLLNNAEDKLSWQDTYELQTLMALTGDNGFDNIDGVYESKTREAVNRFNNRISGEKPEPKPEPKPEQQQEIQPKQTNATPQRPETQNNNPQQESEAKVEQKESVPNNKTNGYGVSLQDIETAWALTQLQESLATVSEGKALISQNPSYAAIADGRIADIINSAQDKDPYTLAEEDIRELQHLMAIRGDNPVSNIDGDMGGTTIKSIAKFNTRTEGQELTVKSNAFDPNKQLAVLDLGHGAILKKGNRADPGAVSKHTGLSEVDVVDKLAPEIAQHLNENGVNVALTRNPGELLRIKNNYGDTLEARAEFAHSLSHVLGAQNVTFVSLHFDSAGPTANDPRIYIKGSAGGAQSALDKNLQENLIKNYRLGDEVPTARTGNYRALRQFADRTPSNANAHSSCLLELGFGSNKLNAEKLREMYEAPKADGQEIANGLLGHMAYKHEIAGLDILDKLTEEVSDDTPINTAHAALPTPVSP